MAPLDIGVVVSAEPLSLSAMRHAATHEAGHAIIALHLKVPFDYVTVLEVLKRQNGGLRGGYLKTRGKRVRCVRKKQGKYYWVDMKAASRDFAKDYITMVYSGMAATELLLNNTYGGDKDEKDIREIAEGWGFSNEELEHFEKKAQRLVRVPRIQMAINHVAVELCLQNVLKEKEVRALYHEARELSAFDREVHR
jgi:hypothetical protein